MTSSPAQNLNPEAWEEAIQAAMRDRKPGLTKLADEALREYPRYPSLLGLAALATLLEEKPERALRSGLSAEKVVSHLCPLIRQPSHQDFGKVCSLPG
jgi:hypothetical protein